MRLSPDHPLHSLAERVSGLGEFRQKMDQRPSPGVGVWTIVNLGWLPRDLDHRKCVSPSTVLFQQLDAAQQRKSSALVGPNTKYGRPLIWISMRGEVFGNPLEKPHTSSQITVDCRREAMRSLVEHQVGAVVVTPLVVHPEFLAAMPTMLEIRKVVREQAGGPKSIVIGHEIAGHLEFGPFTIGGEFTTVGDPRVIGPIHQLWQRFRPFARDVGIEDQPA